MTESNNKDKVTLPGIIYLDIKNYLKEKKEIRQQKKAENRKIKFREIFIENCKKGYHAVRYRYYAHKENKILQGNSELENIQAKKAEEAAKVLDHDESIQIMQMIREDQKAAKKGNEEKVEDALADELSEDKLEEKQNVLNETKENVSEEKQNELDEAKENVSEEKQNDNNEPLAIEGPVYEKEELETVEKPNEEVATEQPVVASAPVENETPVVVEPTREELGQKLTSILRTEAQNRQAEQTVEMDPEIQANLAESAQKIIAEQNNAEDVNAILREVEGLGKSVAQVQQTVVKSLASKQRELDEVNKEKSQLVEANSAKDSEIALLRQQLAEALTAKENAEKEKAIFETQFKDYVANTSPIVERYNSMVSLMGGMAVQPNVQPEVVNEEGYQKTNRI